MSWGSSGEGPPLLAARVLRPGLATGELAERLALRTCEVERISRIGAGSEDGFVVGRVLGVVEHPDADRLRVCEVETGDGARTIVCGAPNVAAGQTVAVGLPGAVLPDGTRLGTAKLRGVESDGMILSEAELEIGDDAAGIAVLAEAEPGTPLALVLPIADEVLELEVNSNRVDCLGVYGVAREVHAFSGADSLPPPGRRTPPRRARARRGITPRSPSRRPSSAPASRRGSSQTSRSVPRRSG